MQRVLRSNTAYDPAAGRLSAESLEHSVRCSWLV